MITMIDAIAAHRAAWQAFQDAPEGEKGSPEYQRASLAEDMEGQALTQLLDTAPQDQQDLQALVAHLEWWVVEEVQRRDYQPQPFALLATIRMAKEAGR